TSLGGYRTIVEAVLFTPDGRSLVAAGHEGIKVWDAPPRQFRYVWPHAEGRVESVAFTAGDRILTASRGGTVRLSDRVTGREQAVPRPLSEARGAKAAITRDGRTLALADGKEATLWDAATGSERARLEGHSGPITVLVFAPDGRTLVTSAGYWDAEVKL